MRIWILNQHAYTPDNSAGTRHFDIARRLIERGHEVLLIAGSFDHKRKVETREYGSKAFIHENVYGVPYLWLRLPAYSRNDLSRVTSMIAYLLVARRAVRAIGSNAPDVIVGSSPTLTAALTASLEARRLGVPFVLEIRDIWPLTAIVHGRYSRLHPYIIVLRALEKWLYRHADAIISTLPRADIHVTETLDRRTEVEWIPNGMSAAQVVASNGSSVFTVMYAGAFGHANDLKTIIEAAARLRGSRDQDDRPIEFHLIGDGEFKEATIHFAVECGADNVRFMDPVPKNRISDLLATADCCVASVRRSPLNRFGISPNKLSDYFAAAKPVVLGVDAANDPVAESGAGITVAPQDSTAMAAAIARIASLPTEERLELGLRGYRYLNATRSFDILTERFEAILDKVVQKR